MHYKKDCSLCKEYKEFFIEKCPEVLWDVIYANHGWSSEVFAFGLYKGKMVFTEMLDGSCDFCGSWDSVEPTKEEIMNSLVMFDTLEEALLSDYPSYIDKTAYKNIMKELSIKKDNLIA